MWADILLIFFSSFFGFSPLHCLVQMPDCHKLHFPLFILFILIPKWFYSFPLLKWISIHLYCQYSICLGYRLLAFQKTCMELEYVKRPKFCCCRGIDATPTRLLARISNHSTCHTGEKEDLNRGKRDICHCHCK